MPEQDHWSSSFEHESLSAPEARESFTKTMSKYESPEAAVIGGYEAMKMAGKPFKLPESMENVDKWPDEKDRDTFKVSLRKLTGAVEKPEDLKDIDWLKGSTLENDKPDEKLVGMISEIAVAEKWPKQIVGRLAELWNGIQAKAREENATLAAQKLKATNDELLKAYNNDEGAMNADLELMRRTFKNHAGLSPEEYEAIADEFNPSDDSQRLHAVVSNPILTKALVRLLAPMSKEGVNDKGNGTPPPPPPAEKTFSEKEGLPKSSAALGWT